MAMAERTRCRPGPFSLFNVAGGRCPNRVVEQMCDYD